MKKILIMLYAITCSKAFSQSEQNGIFLRYKIKKEAIGMDKSTESFSEISLFKNQLAVKKEIKNGLMLTSISDCTSKKTITYFTDNQLFYKCEELFNTQIFNLGQFNTQKCIIKSDISHGLFKGIKSRKASLFFPESEGEMNVEYIEGEPIKHPCFNSVFEAIKGIPIRIEFNNTSITFGQIKGFKETFVLDSMNLSLQQTEYKINDEQKYELVGDITKMYVKIMPLLRGQSKAITDDIQSKSDGKVVQAIQTPQGNIQFKMEMPTSPFSIGKTIPPFEHTTMNGEMLNSKKLDSKVTVINFWFTQCAPCVKEMPMLNDLQKDFLGKSVTFIAVTKDTEDVVKAFLMKRKFEFKHIIDSQPLLNQLGVSVFPTTIILNQSGVIKYSSVYNNPTIEELSKVIEQLLNE